MPVRVSQNALIVQTPRTSKVRVSQNALIVFVPYTPGMSITYPLTPPAISGIGPQDITLQMVNVVGESESPFTLSQQQQQWPGQRFNLEANLPPLTLAEGEQWVTFLGALFGKYGTFLMGDYARLTPQGPLSGSPLVSGTNANGSNTLVIRGAAAGVANWAIAGDYLQLTASAGPKRLHKILQNASTDGSGNVTVAIFPNIRETLVDGLAIVTTNCVGTWRLQENTAQWKIDKNKMYAISFKAKEAI
jgi:hypothetical protein